MGFLERFWSNTSSQPESRAGRSSFDELTESQLDAHLAVRRYGNFVLTDAVRPSYDLQIVPQAGYRHDQFRDPETGIAIPVLVAASSRETVFDLFLDLLDPLGEDVDVVLETSHEQTGGRHHDLYREHIDLPILKSVLYDFEELLLHDGCTGIAVLNPRRPLEVQFDEHKLLMLYGEDNDEFEPTLADYSIEHRPDIQFITEAEHVHSSSEAYYEQFNQLSYRLGIEEGASPTAFD